ncbi:uncharacterized protein DNG_06166 [Cephalotrichum gorgonifer]|uniref:RCC1 domain-containing protein n=1 Tax=Cephalotrichum gorgonifer TaxID=2041049 RepID=A0AAE8N132_9PEZI|nr:uncharacterized protein DNG_06166 [Cephalotrichum gorgonifer]
MELYAAGLNAWSQLVFESVGSGSGSPPAAEPEDVTRFTRVLAAQTIESPVSRLSYTLGTIYILIVKADGTVVAAGCLDTSDADTLNRLYHSVSTATDKTLDTEGRTTLARLADDDHETGQRIQAYDVPVQQLVAYDTGFSALLDDGSVWVNGDARFPNCLGGSPDSDESCTLGPWNKVRWLDDLPTGPVVRIAAGGYTLAALTEGGDLYCWGGRPGQKPLFDELSYMPIPIDLGVDADVKDVALGDRHIVALTTDGRVFVQGCNKNGQLGLGEGARAGEGWRDWVGEWNIEIHHEFI